MDATTLPEFDFLSQKWHNGPPIRPKGWHDIVDECIDRYSIAEISRKTKKARNVIRYYLRAKHWRIVVTETRGRKRKNMKRHQIVQN